MINKTNIPKIQSNQINLNSFCKLSLKTDSITLIIMLISLTNNKY